MVSSHSAPRPDGRERQGETRATIASVCWEPVVTAGNVRPGVLLPRLGWGMLRGWGMLELGRAAKGELLQTGNTSTALLREAQTFHFQLPLASN